MAHLRLGPRLTAAVVLPLVLAAAVALVALRTVAELQPGGGRATEATTAREVAAQLRAPGQYLLEAFLVAHQLPTVDPSSRAPLLVRLESLRAASDAQRQAWSERLPEGALRSGLVDQVGGTAQAFWVVVDNDLRPETAGGPAGLQSVLVGPLSDAFTRHGEAAAEVARLADEQAAAADDEASELADRRRWIVVVMLVIGAALAVLVAAAIARSVVRRVEQLRRTVMRATSSLEGTTEAGGGGPPPAPEGMDRHDELGETAAAVGTLVATAGRLTVGEDRGRQASADVFVNLGRRNQGLVTRQLQLLGELERSETDPRLGTALGQLDHLATCIRRNAESLLVIAGFELPQRRRRPLGAIDVAYAAASETEQADRVRLGPFPPLAVTGELAPSLVHLLAELIDNALRFSPPTTAVTVSARQHDGELLIAVRDAGMGMSPDALEDANALLAAGGEGTTPGAHLGHLVISRLAARYGLEVELDSVAGEGVLARVTVPAHLVDPTPMAHTPSAGNEDRPVARDEGRDGGQDEGRDEGGGEGAPRSGRAKHPTRGGGPVVARGTSGATRGPPESARGGADAAGGAPGTGDGSEAVVPPPETTPSGFRRRVPKRPAAPRSGATAQPADRARGLRPLPTESAPARKARLESFVAGRSTAGELLGLGEESPADDEAGGTEGKPAPGGTTGTTAPARPADGARNASGPGPADRSGAEHE